MKYYFIGSNTPGKIELISEIGPHSNDTNEEGKYSHRLFVKAALIFEDKKNKKCIACRTKVDASVLTLPGAQDNDDIVFAAFNALAKNVFILRKDEKDAFIPIYYKGKLLNGSGHAHHFKEANLLDFSKESIVLDNILEESRQMPKLKDIYIDSIYTGRALVETSKGVVRLAYVFIYKVDSIGNYHATSSPEKHYAGFYDKIGIHECAHIDPITSKLATELL